MKPASSHSGSGGAGDLFSPGRFALVLALLIVGTFPLVVTGGRVFAFQDSGQFAYPVAFYLRESFWRGELPFWDPLNSCGIPFLAQWNTLALYPPSLFYLLLPMPWSFEVFCLGHLFLAGLGMYFLARRWTGSEFGAAVAGVAFAFNGFTWYGLAWPHLLGALGWMPWVVLTAEKAWLRGGRRAVGLAGLVFALQLLSGGAEAILLTGLLLAGLWGLAAIRAEVPRWKLLGRALAVGLLAFALAAVQLLPFLDLLLHSQRGGSAAHSALSDVAAMPLSGWANYLVPLFHYVRTETGTVVQSGQTWVGSYYAGIAVVALALLALLRVRNERVRLLAIISVFGVFMAMGNRAGLYSQLKVLLPPLGLIRFLVKFLMLPLFALPLLAGWAVAHCQETASKAAERRWLKGVGLAMGLLTILIVGWTMVFPLYPSEPGIVSASALGRLVFLGAALLLLGRSGSASPRGRRLMQLGFVLLLWLDVGTHLRHFNPTAPASVYKPDVVRQQLGWEASACSGRALLSRDALWHCLEHGSPEPALDLMQRREAFSMNLNLLDHTAKFDGFFSMDLSDYFELFKRFYFTDNQAAGLVDFLGVEHVSNPTNVFAWNTRSSALPLLSAGQEPIFESPTNTRVRLLGAEFAPRQEVFLPPEARDAIRAQREPSARIGSASCRPQHLTFETDSAGPALVVVAQTYYHPWQARVDGRRVRLWKANYAFQALEVPAGHHRVRLDYWDWAFWSGLAATVAGAGVCLGLVTRKSPGL